MKHDATDRLLDPDRELEESFARTVVSSGIGVGRAGGAAPAFLEQNVRGQRDEDPKLVAQDLRATGPIHFETVMQFLEPILGVPALAVCVVDGSGVGGEVRDHKAGVILGIAPRMADRLGLDDHAALIRSS